MREPFRRMQDPANYLRTPNMHCIRKLGAPLKRLRTGRQTGVDYSDRAASVAGVLGGSQADAESCHQSTQRCRR
jgi:hypothetical protein